MDNLLSMIEGLTWLRVLSYSTLSLIFLHRATTALRYRAMHYALCTMFLVAVVLGVAIIISPEIVVWLRALQTPVVLCAAICGVRQWLREGKHVVKREVGLVILNNQPCGSEEQRHSSNSLHPWDLTTR